MQKLLTKSSTLRNVNELFAADRHSDVVDVLVELLADNARTPDDARLADDTLVDYETMLVRYVAEV